MQQKFCNKCGGKLSPGDKFCNKCGAPIKRKEPDNFPKYDDIAARFNNPHVIVEPETDAGNPEGTVLLVGNTPAGNNIRKAELKLPFGDLLRGCNKVVDFGTGERFEIAVPAGLSPGDVLIVQDTGIRDPLSGAICEFELTIAME